MSKALATKNVAAVLLGAALVVTFAFAFAAPAKADTVSDLQAQVQALLAQIASLQGGSTTSTSSSGAGCHTFTQNLRVGATGGEVMWMQQFLNGHGYQVAKTGAGSPGNETSHFGPATKAAVIKFQNAYKADILTPVGLTTGTGNWLAATRAKANALCAGSTTGGTTGGTTTGGTTAGGNLMIAAGTQPANSLAPAGASRVPFTTFTLTNTSGAPVTVTGVTVQRTGLAQDNNFAGVILVDSNGLQIGTAHTFDSNHMTTVGDTMTINAGQSVTLTVAGNMAASGTIHSGEVASLSVTGVNVSSGTVGGSLPITGAMHTMNNTLVMGSVTVNSSSFDPVTQATKHIGDTGIKFSGVRFTAGSAEDVKFYSIRWRLNGSVSPSDLANVTTVVNGTSYPTTVSADGRYYTAVFPGGILMSKGNSVDAYVQGDIVGNNASGRTVEFDIDKTYDVYFVGQTYGYGISISSTSGGSYSTVAPHDTGWNTANQPWFSGSTVSVQGGQVTSIQNATNVPSQNVAVNVPNQVLGGFQTNFLGEPVTIQGLTINVASSSVTAGSVPLTLVSIVDENGAVVAGPVDMSAYGSTLSFTNSITFPTGIHTYTLKGKLASGFTNGDTVTLSTTPSTGWTSPQGQTTGNTVSLSSLSSPVTMNVMTVRSATLSIAAGSNPASQNVVKGGQNIQLATIQLDASQSGEDLRISSLPINAAVVTGSPLGSLNTCQIWDGSTSLTTGSNVKNTISAGNNTFTFDNSLTITKGTTKTLTVSCSLSTSATNGDQFKLGVSHGATFSITGLQSGNSLVLDTNLTVSNPSSYSGTMTVSGGASVTAAVDSSSPSYNVAAAGTTGVTVGVIKLRASNENVNLTKLGLSAAGGTYGSASTGSGNAGTASGDLMTVYLYNSAGTQIGTATFLSGNTVATSTLSTPLVLTRDTDTLITVKADLATIGVSNSGGIGNLVKVDPLNFEGTGANSGTTVRGGATGTTAGVRMFKSYPTLALDTLSSTGVADGRLMRFKITANAAGPVGVAQFNMNIATSSSVTATNVQLFGFTDSAYSNGISGQGSGGQIGNTAASLPGSGNVTFTPTNPVEVPAGSTYYFELRASVGNVVTGSSVVAKLLGDAAYPTALTTGVYNVATSSAITGTSNFVWSGNSTSTAATGDIDWSNGYSIPGLPSSGLIQTRSN